MQSSRTLKDEARRSNQEVYDKLIAVFEQRRPDSWRKLIAVSKQWPTLAPGLFDRIEALAAAAEADPDRQVALLKLGRRLRALSDEVQQHSALVEEFRAAPSRDWEALVMRHRPGMGPEFFAYVDARIGAAAADAERAAEVAGGKCQRGGREEEVCMGEEEVCMGEEELCVGE